MPAPILQVKDLTVQYGGVRAVDHFDLEVRGGQIVGLIGPNGAGKTSLIDALTGFTRCKGSVRLRGQELSNVAPHKKVVAGLSRTWQSVELFDDLTVYENLVVASTSRRWDRAGPRTKPTRSDHHRMLAQLGLDEVADRRPDELSQGQRKLVTLARALTGKPDVLLADEPAAGLDSAESAALGRQLRGIADNSTSILLVDHDMGLVLGLCDYIYVMEFGRPLADGTPADIRRNPNVIAAYLGQSVEPVRDGQIDLDPTP